MKIKFASIFFALVSFLFAFQAIADTSLSEDLKKTCRSSYRSKPLQNECVVFCGYYREFKKYSKKERNLLVDACHIGQVIYLKSIVEPSSAEERDFAVKYLMEICGQNYEGTPHAAKACKIGVTSEDLRKNPKKKGPGTSSDGERETGR